jgi:large subunit ribosomal protein L22
VPGPKTNEREGTRAVLKDARFSAYKAREVLDLIRGLDVARARDVLQFCERDAAIDVGKVLDSAIANAEHNDQLDPEELFVSACFADEGRTLKRGRPRARGRYTRIRKRTCHITIIVSRLPEDRLGRLRAKQTADQANRRARRVAGGRRAEGAEGDGSRRTRRSRGGAPETITPEATADEVEAEAVEADVEAVDVEAVDVEAVDVEAVDVEAVDVEAVDESEASAGGEALETEAADPGDADSSAESGESAEAPADGADAAPEEDK